MNESSLADSFATGNSNLDAIEQLPLSYVEMDASGMITRANRAALAMHPRESGEMVGRLAWDLIAADEREQSRAAYLSVMQSGDVPSPVLRSVYTQSGQYRTFEIHRNLIRGRDGLPMGMRMVSVDVTQAKRELDEAQRAYLWHESVMESTVDAVIVTDALGFIRVVNPAAEELFGWKAHELIGKVIEKALPLVKYAAESGPHLTFTMALEGPCRGIATLLDREHAEIQVELSTHPIFEKGSGFTTGVLSVLRGVKDPQQNDEQAGVPG